MKYINYFFKIILNLKNTEILKNILWGIIWFIVNDVIKK